jgi:hypothetical protein
MSINSSYTTGSGVSSMVIGAQLEEVLRSQAECQVSIQKGMSALMDVLHDCGKEVANMGQGLAKGLEIQKWIQVGLMIGSVASAGATAAAMGATGALSSQAASLTVDQFTTGIQLGAAGVSAGCSTAQISLNGFKGESQKSISQEQTAIENFNSTTQKLGGTFSFSTETTTSISESLNAMIVSDGACKTLYRGTK